MAWTESDLAQVQAAIVRLVAGEDVATATLNGQSVTYTKARLPELRALRSEMLREIEDGSAPSRVKLARCSDKGL